MTAVPILHTLQSTGSQFGLSYYSRLAECPRKAVLDAEVSVAKRTGEPGRIMGHNALRSKSSSENKATLIGVIFHALLEHYYRGSFGSGNFAIEIGDDLGWDGFDVAQVEAERLFRAYREKFAPDELGEVLAIEHPLPRQLDDGSYDTEELRAVGLAVGMLPFTCRLDMVVRIDETAAARLSMTRGITVEPGVWIVDHKTALRRNKGEPEYRENSLQATAYTLAYNVTRGVDITKASDQAKLAKGVLFNVTYKLKEPDFKTFIAIATEAQTRQLHSFFEGIQRILNDPEMRVWANAGACYNHMTMNECHWRTVGVCNGS